MFSVKPLRFASGENDKLLFQTHRLNVYQTGDLENQDVSWNQLKDIWGGVHGVFQDAFNPQTPEEAHPSREVHGLRIELRGKGQNGEGFTAKKLREDLTSWFKSSLASLKESVFVFFKKIWATVWASNSKLETSGKVFNGLFGNITGTQQSAPPNPGPSA